MEGFNPSHDLCRFLINAAVSLLRQRTQRELGNFDFLLDGSPRDCPADLQDRAVRVELEDAALERKLAAAQGYPELSAEAETALARFGPQLFRTEWLRPVADWRQGLDGWRRSRRTTSVSARAGSVQGTIETSSATARTCVRW